MFTLTVHRIQSIRVHTKDYVGKDGCPPFTTTTLDIVPQVGEPQEIKLFHSYQTRIFPDADGMVFVKSADDTSRI